MSEATIYNKLIGKAVKSAQATGDEFEIQFNDGSSVFLYHAQDCCESVTIEDICGDVSDMIDGVINEFECVTNSDDLMGKDIYESSFTWSFYKISTNKGGIVIRWFGESNGYYSETVQVTYTDENGIQEDL
jgi:hypothetical protein